MTSPIAPLPEAILATDLFAPFDRHFAAMLLRLEPQTPPAVLIAAALVTRATREGHICLSLREYASRGAASTPLPPWDTLEPQLRASAFVTTAEAERAAPLVLEGDRLYLARSFDYETRLARALERRLAPRSCDETQAWALEAATHARRKAALDRLFGPTRPGDVDLQKLAAALACTSPFCLISGGPGTGKTTTVARIVTLLIEESKTEDRPFEVLLLAPTGKAAERLGAAMTRAKPHLATTPEVLAHVPEVASTIHRALGPLGRGRTRFRHDAENPLPYDVVILDEASMVDLALMTKLIEAVPEQSRLILLGDKDQLTSVEAGAVFGDLYHHRAPTAYSRVRARQLETLTGQAVSVAPDLPAIADSRIHLTHTFRYRDDSALGGLAREIREGNVHAVLDMLQAGDDGSVRFIEAADPLLLRRALVGTIRGGFASYLRAPCVAHRLAALSEFRVLCPHREGLLGTFALNTWIDRLLFGGRADGGPCEGQTVLVERNDAEIDLWNGDVGVLAKTEAGLRAFFLRPEAPHEVSLFALPPHTSAFAMTVHKAQGSEFDHVVLVLPPQGSMLLSRELLYTAVTRARTRVEIYGTSEVIATAVARPIVRASGLAERLWGRA